MNIKMLRDKRGHNIGDVIELPDNEANLFIVQGLAEKHTGPLPAVKAKPQAKAKTARKKTG